MIARVLNLTLFLLVVTLIFRNKCLLDAFGNSPQFSFTLAGSFAVYLATKPAKREIITTILIGILLRFAFSSTVGISSYFGSKIISLTGFIGIASIIVLAYKSIYSLDIIFFFRTAAFFPFVSVLVGFILPITNSLSPVTFDAHLLAVDGTFGVQPSFVLGRILHKYSHWMLWECTTTIYYALPLPIALLCAFHLTKNKNVVRRLLSLYGVMSVAGFCLYAVCPGTGPIYAFREWYPMNPPNLSEIDIAPLSLSTFPRNAMPSLHLTAALLVFWNTFGMRKSYRIAAGSFLGGTAFATLALGEHYLIDLIVAFPFSLIFQSIFTDIACNNSRLRYYAMTGSAALVGGWLIMLRFLIHHLIMWPVITLLLSLSTLGFTLLMRRQLVMQCIEFSKEVETWDQKDVVTS